jgi:hypothetical protein
MLKVASVVVCGVMASFLACEARAFPVASVSARITTPDVLQVRDFCGLGFHRDIYGYCVRNGVPYVAPGPVVVAPPLVVAPAVVVAPRVCPYGYVWAPAYGRCVPL